MLPVDTKPRLSHLEENSKKKLNFFKKRLMIIVELMRPALELFQMLHMETSESDRYRWGGVSRYMEYENEMGFPMHIE